MKIIISPEEMNALQGMVDEIGAISKELEPDTEIEIYNIVQGFKDNTSKCYEAYPLPGGDIEVDINVELAVEYLTVYKEVVIEFMPIVDKAIKAYSNGIMKFAKMIEKWM